MNLSNRSNNRYHIVVPKCLAEADYDAMSRAFRRLHLVDCCNKHFGSIGKTLSRLVALNLPSEFERALSY
jgi:hypothetical protein